MALVRFQEQQEESEVHGPVEVFMTVAGRPGKGRSPLHVDLA